MTKQMLEQYLVHEAYFGEERKKNRNKSIPVSFLLLLVNRRLVVWNQYNKETYIKAHLTRLIDGCAVENGRGRDIHGLMNKHGGTKGYRSNTVLFLGAFISANVPVHLLEITVIALLQIGGGGRGLAYYVSRVCATLPRLRAPEPGRSSPEKVDRENKKKVGIKTRRVNSKPSVVFVKVSISDDEEGNVLFVFSSGGRAKRFRGRQRSNSPSPKAEEKKTR